MDVVWFVVGFDGDDFRVGVCYKLVFFEKRDN